MRYRQQFDLTDCGAACLAMIASYFGKQVSVAQVREFTKTDTEGTNLQGLVDGAATMGLSAQGKFQCSDTTDSGAIHRTH